MTSTALEELVFFRWSEAGNFSVLPELFSRAWKESKMDTLSTILYIRSRRDLDWWNNTYHDYFNREVFMIFIEWLLLNEPTVLTHNDFLKAVAEIGTYKDIIDIYYLVDKNRKDSSCLNVVTEILIAIVNFYTNCLMTFEKPHLVFKWAPMETNNDQRRKLANIFASEMGLTCKEYRKLIVSGREGFLEGILCDPSVQHGSVTDVPISAKKRYNNVFQRRHLQATPMDVPTLHFHDFGNVDLYKFVYSNLKGTASLEDRVRSYDNLICELMSLEEEKEENKWLTTIVGNGEVPQTMNFVLYIHPEIKRDARMFCIAVEMYSLIYEVTLNRALFCVAKLTENTIDESVLNNSTGNTFIFINHQPLPSFVNRESIGKNRVIWWNIFAPKTVHPIPPSLQITPLSHPSHPHPSHPSDVTSINGMDYLLVSSLFHCLLNSYMISSKAITNYLLVYDDVVSDISDMLDHTNKSFLKIQEVKELKKDDGDYPLSNKETCIIF